MQNIQGSNCASYENLSGKGEKWGWEGGKPGRYVRTQDAKFEMLQLHGQQQQ